MRGTGSNYGESGFLRPGFSLRNGLDYLHSKIIEFRESGQDLDHLLSPDWKVKFAAALVPRGMELNDDFMSALQERILRVTFEKFIADVSADDRIKVNGIEVQLRQQFSTMDLKRFSWVDFLSELNVNNNGTRSHLAEPHVAVAKRLSQACLHIVEHATELHLYNRRISSELSNQPKPVDSIVDDFAVEAQNFANSLALSSAFAAGALAFRLINVPTADVVSAVLGALNIAISFGTMTNVGRYKIRNEESRIEFMDAKYTRARKAVYKLIADAPDSVLQFTNPFISCLDAKVALFRQNVTYYGYEEPTEFKHSCLAMRSNTADIKLIQHFQKKLATKFMLEYENSYVQEVLVDVHREVEELVSSLTETTMKNEAAKPLFDRLNAFEPQLSASMQRGAVRWGFIKQRNLAHWDIVVALRYIVSLFWFHNATESSKIAPIETETLGILDQMKTLFIQHKSDVLRREIRDVEALYWATRESGIASLIFLVAFLVFVSSSKLQLLLCYVCKYIFGSSSHSLDCSFSAVTCSHLYGRSPLFDRPTRGCSVLGRRSFSLWSHPFPLPLRAQARHLMPIVGDSSDQTPRSLILRQGRSP